MTKINASPKVFSLPMHDWPEIRPHTDRFAQALADALGVAGALERGADYHQPWHDPNLAFSQTCGYPLTHELKGKVTYVATPHYDADGCEGANYCSIVFAREKRDLSDFKNTRAVINNPDSMSGMLALKLVFSDLAKGTFFSDVKQSGSHINSLKMVAAGEADVCAIDCVTVALARRYRPELLQGLQEITRSPQVPGLPLITNLYTAEKVQAALADVMSDPDLQTTRHALLLQGYSILPANAYDVITYLERKHPMQLA